MWHTNAIREMSVACVRISAQRAHPTSNKNIKNRYNRLAFVLFFHAHFYGQSSTQHASTFKYIASASLITVFFYSEGVSQEQRNCDDGTQIIANLVRGICVAPCVCEMRDATANVMHEMSNLRTKIYSGLAFRFRLRFAVRRHR